MQFCIIFSPVGLGYGLKIYVIYKSFVASWATPSPDPLPALRPLHDGTFVSHQTRWFACPPHETTFYKDDIFVTIKTLLYDNIIWKSLFTNETGIAL